MRAMSAAFDERVARLIELSRVHYGSPFSEIKWVDAIEEESWWLGPELLSIYGTPYFEQADESMLKRLSKWECINLFSLTLTGEQELIAQIMPLIHHPVMGNTYEYLHHFVDEENKHMWYFAHFCKTYGGKIYGNKKARLEEPDLPEEVALFLVFARICIFEEVGHYFNVKVPKDQRIHPLIRQINQAHFVDEARHIAFGRGLMTEMARDLKVSQTPELLDLLARQLITAMLITVDTLYNSAAYRDAGYSKGVRMRAEVMAHQARVAFDRDILLGRVLGFFRDIKLISEEHLIGTKLATTGSP